MSSSKRHSSTQNGLFGVPKIVATLWWRIVFWQDAIGINNVPEQFRSAGMHCPRCGKRQPFSDRCSFCKCVFACFVFIKTNQATRNKLPFNATFTPGNTKPSISYRFFASLHAFFNRFSKYSIRVRAIAASLMILLLISLTVGIVQYRSYERRHYVYNFVQALYVIKSGMNLGEMVCNGTFNAWRGVESSAAPEDSGIDPQALADLKAVEAEINRIMREMGTPTTEYSQAARILQKIYALYEKTNSIVINSPDSLSKHNADMVAAGEDFSREIENLKANLPASIVEELKKASQKYDLRFMALEK